MTIRDVAARAGVYPATVSRVFTRPDAVAPKPAVSIATMRTILAHARRHPTVYLPSHDPESVARLRDRTTLSPR